MHVLERAMLCLEELKGHIRVTHFLPLRGQLETRSAFVSSKTRGGTLGSLATVHKKVLITLERANTSFEKGDLRVKSVDDYAAGVLPFPQIDATQ